MTYCARTAGSAAGRRAFYDWGTIEPTEANGRQLIQETGTLAAGQFPGDVRLISTWAKDCSPSTPSPSQSYILGDPVQSNVATWIREQLYAFVTSGSNPPGYATLWR